MHASWSDEVRELADLWPCVESLEEQGKAYFRFPNLPLPPGCDPRSTTALLCAHERDGYPSRMFFSQVIRSPTQRNWNTRNAFIAGGAWHAFSWRVDPATNRLAQVVRAFLRALE